jgi:uncharacterized membrane protein YccC
MHRSCAWLGRGLTRLDVTSPRATYVLRSILAAWLALVVAYGLDLEMPYSAASTVLLVIHPVQGAVIGKGSWRVLGTLVGMLVALLLMAAFGQMPWLFLLGFGCWLGLCVAGMTLLRHFRASGTVVAGYTVGLATYGALQHPLLSFEHVLGRGSTVLVGVGCLVLVSALLSTRSMQGKLDVLLRRLAVETADTLAAQHQAAEVPAPASERMASDRRRLITEIYSVDDVLALGKAESAELAQRAAALRSAMASLFAAVVGGTLPLAANSTSRYALHSLRPMLEQGWKAVAQAVADGPAGVAAAQHRLQHMRECLRAALDDMAQTHPAEGAALLIAGDRLIEQMDDYQAALQGWLALHGPLLRQSPAPVRFHRDLTAAWHNGLRAMLTLVLAGAFWLLSGWQHGDMMLLVLAPYCALLATAANPAAGATAFIKGTVIAVPLAWICAFGVLPHIQGLPLLLVVLGLFWLPGIWATSMPQHALAGLAYLVAFNTLAAAANPMHYDLALFLNWSAAWVLATCLTLLGFRLLLPRNGARDVQRLRDRIRDEAVAVLRGKRAQRGVWQLHQQHRMAQLGSLLKADSRAMDQAIGDALASLHLGRELLRLRQWLGHGTASTQLHAYLAATLRRMAARADAPRLAARHAQRAAHSVLRRADWGPDRLRLAAALTDVAVLLQTHSRYFSTPFQSAFHAQ